MVASLGTMNPHPASPNSRRFFLKVSAAATLAPSVLLTAESGKKKKKSSTPMKNAVCCFNKPLQHLSYDEQAKLVAEIGFDGIEGTVRKGGHVEPEHVERDLPKQIEALKKHGVEMTLMTSGINNVEAPENRLVLQTAAKLGVKRFRMKPYKYDYKKSIPIQLEEFRKTYRDLIQFCNDLNIRPLYQNHAGAKYFGASIWDLYLLMKDEPKDQTGMCFDIRHATAEGGLSWPTEFHLMKPFFGMVYCKDFLWDKEKRKPLNVPLGTGMVSYPLFFSMLRKIKYTNPISLHMEYKDHRDPKLLKESIAAIREDYKTLRGFMG